MLPLVGRTAQHQGLLFPDARPGEVEAGVRERLSEVQPLGVRMEHIDRGIVRHDFLGILKRCQQEVIEGGVLHVVVLDLPGAALVVDIVGRVGDDQVGL